MRFEWDPNKGKANLKNRGVSFEEAITAFYDPLSATFADPDHSGGEEGFVTVGYSSTDRLLFVSHLDQEETLRIISARTATAHERKRHEGETSRTRG